MNIIIPNYENINFDTKGLFVSDVGISRVYSRPLLEVLKILSSSKVIAKEELDEILAEYGIDQNEAFEFLGRIIPLKAVEEIYFEKTVIAHDWKGQADVEGLFRDGLSGPLEFKSFSSEIVESVRHLKCFVVLLCHSYNYGDVKKLYFDLLRASPQSAISVCWRMGNVFCVGQPCVAEIGNPCHFCIVDRLINDELVVPARNNWASVLAFCKSERLDVPVKALSLYQEMIVVGAIVREVKFFTEYSEGYRYQDNVLHGSYLRLSDGQIFQEAVSHWYMCDCLRGGE